jgi:hypothetical protein
MRLDAMRYGVCLLAAMLFWPLPGSAAAPVAKGTEAPAVAVRPIVTAAVAQYRRKLANYAAARRKYESAANGYWTLDEEAKLQGRKRSGGAVWEQTVGDRRMG